MPRYRIHVRLTVRLTVDVRLPVRLTVGLTLPRCAFVIRKGGPFALPFTLPFPLPLPVGRIICGGVYNLWVLSFLFFFEIRVLYKKTQVYEQNSYKIFK